MTGKLMNCECYKHALVVLLIACQLLLLCSIAQCSSVVEFRRVVEGEIEPENFSYYFVDGEVYDILLNLTSVTGDCDLYVAQAASPGTTPVKPSTEIESYDLQSTTCGQDVILVDRTFHRPFCVGIYAHPSYSNCTFRLEIIAFSSEDLYNESTSEVPNSLRDRQRRQQSIHSDESSEEVEKFTNRFFSLLFEFLYFVAELFLDFLIWTMYIKH